jgi:hypothetical protein
VFKGVLTRVLTSGWPRLTKGVIRDCRWCLQGDGSGWPSFDQGQLGWPDH